MQKQDERRTGKTTLNGRTGTNLQQNRKQKQKIKTENKNRKILHKTDT
nr:MAG TPA: hypothetical protein [Inoviridae sp.]